MKGSFRCAKNMAMENIPMPMDLFTKGIGTTTREREKGK